MYFAIVKLTFASDLDDESRPLRSLTESLRTKFKISAAVVEHSGPPQIAIAALSSSDEKLTKLLDAVMDACEDFGIGRIESEEALVDHIDAIQDLAEAP